MTIFQKIINREIPAKIVWESETVLAFYDINPQAPIHILIIPKQAISNLYQAEIEDTHLLGELLLTSKLIAQELNIIDGYRIVVNNGEQAGQEVPHLHLHLLAGRRLTWPPG